MSLESVYFVAESTAAIAVIATLYYVAREVRHNTKAVKASTYQSVANGSIHLLESLINSEATAHLYFRGLYHAAELSEEEKIRWHSLMLAVYRHWDNLCYQYRIGALEEEMWLSYDRTMSAYLKFHAWVNWFQVNHDLFSQHLQELIIQKIKEMKATNEVLNK
jgi:hypothetical protein